MVVLFDDGNIVVAITLLFTLDVYPFSVLYNFQVVLCRFVVLMIIIRQKFRLLFYNVYPDLFRPFSTSTYYSGFHVSEYIS